MQLGRPASGFRLDVSKAVEFILNSVFIYWNSNLELQADDFSNLAGNW